MGPIHSDHHLDAYLGNMVANRHCEINQSFKDYVVLICGCPKGHIASVRREISHDPGYSRRKITDIDTRFQCC